MSTEKIEMWKNPKLGTQSVLIDHAGREKMQNCCNLVNLNRLM